MKVSLEQKIDALKRLGYSTELDKNGKVSCRHPESPNAKSWPILTVWKRLIRNGYVKILHDERRIRFWWEDE